MASYRSNLENVLTRPFITDGGLETTLIFKDGFDLPCFAAFTILDSQDGIDALRRYYRSYADIAKQYGAGLILESPTWRASKDWGDQLGIPDEEMGGYNRKAIDLLANLRDELEAEGLTVLISGCIGPRGDGYSSETTMSAQDSERYHTKQIRTLGGTEVDMVAAFTMTNASEAIGIVRAAANVGVPSVISFTVETDGRLPDGTPLREAVEIVDSATGSGPVYYMINCAHPTHFSHALSSHGSWLDRIRAIRANASSMSHEELDEATELDDGDPMQLAREYASLKGALRNLTVFGGCCGTDHRHVAKIGEACLMPI